LEENLSNHRSPSSSSHVNRSGSSNNEESPDQATTVVEREIITPTPSYVEAMRRASKMLREAHKLLCPKQEGSEDHVTENGEILISPDSPISSSSNDSDSDPAKAKSLIRQVIRVLENESRRPVDKSYDQKSGETQQTSQPAEPMQHDQAEDTEMGASRETEPGEDIEAEFRELSDEALADEVARGKANVARLQEEVREKKERLRILQAEIAADDEEEFGR